MILTQKIRFSMLKVKVLDPMVQIEDPGHILIDP